MVPSQGQGTTLTAQLRRGVLEYCVLALLQSEERYAFDLVRDLAQLDGMVISEGPPRRYYRLSAAGRKALLGFKREWSTFRDAVDHVIEGGKP
jgi:PadR family transcriptional regulator PadR